MLHNPLTTLYVFIVSLLLIISLSACSAQPIKRVTLHQGLDYKELLDAYGKPYKQGYITETEQTRYYWKLSEARLERSRRYQSSPTVTSSGAVSSGSSNPFQNTTITRIYCTLIVNIDQQNKVASWKAEGAGCRQILFNQI